MRHHRETIPTILACALLAACGPADDVEVQPLPSLTALSAEARAGVPTVAGRWSFAGWEVAQGDSASLRGALPGLGSLRLTGQKRDSVGGSYVVDGRNAPLAGEIRRDSTLALVTFLSPGDGRYLTGAVERDTIWLALTSLVDPARWPDGARAAFVRGAVAQPFRRMRDILSARVRADSLRSDSLRAEAALRADSTAAANAPAASPQPVSPAPAPSREPARPADAAERDTSAPAPAAPAPVLPRPPQPQPRPVDTIQPPPPTVPPLLGVPVPADSVRDPAGTVPR